MMLIHRKWRRWLAGLAFAVTAFSGSALAADCKLGAADVYHAAQGSVVRIFNVAIDPFEPRDKVRYSVGTGFVIDKDGTILTNYHVLLDSVRLSLRFASGVSMMAAPVAGDPILDIAIVRPTFTWDKFKYLELAEDKPPAIGTDVYAIGHPLGLPMSVSRGIVSATDVVLPVSVMSWDAPYIQTDAAINPGNSGGPLLDGCGRVVGMNSLGASFAENIGFAIPAATLRKAVSQLLGEDGRIIRPWIGISGQMADEFISSLAGIPVTDGFMVETVEPGSAAYQAGLRGGLLPLRIGSANYLLGGDILKSVNGTPLTDLGTVARIVRALKPGDTIKVEYFRDGEVETIESTLPERPMLADDIRVLYRNVYREQYDGGPERGR